MLGAVEEQRDKGILKYDLEQAMQRRFGKALYEKLCFGKVAVAGLGGLGSHIAVMLARCGVGQLRLIDFDRVELTNINRQIYELSDIGRYKADALQDKLARINPYLTVYAHIEKVTPDNLQELFADADIVCEAFDDPVQKAMLVNGILTKFPDKPVVAASGVAGFGDCNAIQTHRAFANLYICGDGSCEVSDTLGLLAPRVMVCAGHQANKVIELLANGKPYEMRDKE